VTKEGVPQLVNVPLRSLKISMTNVNVTAATLNYNEGRLNLLGMRLGD